MEFPVVYKNGTYVTHTSVDGVQLTVDPTGEFKADFPDTVDLKVTNKCNAQCYFCHENSVITGKHADYDALVEMLELFPYGVELAIGGGNPLTWPHLDEFLTWAKDKFICNMTVNGVHVVNDRTLERLIEFQSSKQLHGIGISSVTPGFDMTNFGLKYEDHGLKNVVGHIIPALWNRYITKNEVENLTSKDSGPFLSHYLMLGYKRIGRGVRVDHDLIEENTIIMRSYMPRIMTYMRALGIKLSFDNLALSQLSIKNIVTQDAWDKYYIGEDGTRSLFIDAVAQKSARSSTSPERWGWTDLHPLEHFTELQHAVL
jgi:hypothetical protein